MIHNSLLTGFLQGCAFGFSFSTPLFICFRRLLLQGFSAGLLAYGGTVAGQTFFLSCLFFGFTPFIELWYFSEPFLYFAGSIASIKLAIDFYKETNNSSNQINVFFGSFFLMLCNPVLAFNASRWIIALPTNTPLYILGITFGFFLCATLVGLALLFLVQSLGVLSTIPSRTFFRRINKVISLIITTLIISATTQYTWRLFLQYPLDVSGISILQRQFLMFDTNIERRDQNLFVQRHMPVDRFRMRREFYKKPLTESQAREVALRYESHILTRCTEFMTQQQLRWRTPISHQRTPEQILRLQKVKEILRSEIQNESSRELTNRTKGKPKFAYVRELST